MKLVGPVTGERTRPRFCVYTIVPFALCLVTNLLAVDANAEQWDQDRDGNYVFKIVLQEWTQEAPNSPYNPAATPIFDQSVTGQGYIFLTEQRVPGRLTHVAVNSTGTVSFFYDNGPVQTGTLAFGGYMNGDPQQGRYFSFGRQTWVNGMRVYFNVSASPPKPSGGGGTPPTPVSNTIYVSPSGNNNNTGLSRAQALKTVQAAFTKVTAGKTIVIAPGTYTESLELTKNTASTQGIKVAVDTGASTTGDVIIKNTQADFGVVIDCKIPLTFEGLVFESGLFAANTGVDRHGLHIKGNTDDIIFTNCTFREYGCSVLANGPDNIAFNQCSFGNTWSHKLNAINCGNVSIDNCTFSSPTPRSAEGISVRLNECDDVTITNSTFSGVYEAITATVTPVAIENCAITNPRATGIRLMGTSTFDMHYAATLSDVTVSSSSDSGIGIKLEGNQLTSCTFDDVSVQGTRHGLWLDSTLSSPSLTMSQLAISNCVNGLVAQIPSLVIDSNDSVTITGCDQAFSVYHALNNRGVFELYDQTISGNKIGVLTVGARPKIIRCSFDQCDSGIVIQQCDRAEIRNTTLVGKGNTVEPQAGIDADCPQLILADTAVSAYTNGVVGRNFSNNCQLQNLTINDNTSTGLSLVGGTWSCTNTNAIAITNSNQGILCDGANVTLTGLTFPTGCNHPVSQNGGSLNVVNGTCNSGAVALVSTQPSSLSVNGLVVNNCQDAGVQVVDGTNVSVTSLSATNSNIGLTATSSVATSLTLTGCNFQNNASAGLQVIGNPTMNVSIAGLAVANSSFGVDLENLTAALSGGQNNLLINSCSDAINATNCVLTVEDLTVSSGTRSIACSNSTLELRDSIVTGTTYAVTAQNSVLTAAETRFNATLQYQADGNSTLTVENCEFIPAVATMNGIECSGVGGTPTATISGSTFQGGRDGLLSSATALTLTNCSIENVGRDGLFVSSGSTVIENSVIRNPGFWGALAVGTHFEFRNSQVLDAWVGIAIATDNATVVNSVVEGAGLGMYAGCVNATFNLNHVTFVSPSGAAVQLGPGNMQIVNCILQAGSQAISNPLQQANVTHRNNLIAASNQPFTNVGTGTEEIFRDPIFVDPAANNFRLAAGSPAINSGIDAGVTTDIEGNARPSFGRVEMGAYEFTSARGSTRILDWEEVAN